MRRCMPAGLMLALLIAPAALGAQTATTSDHSTVVPGHQVASPAASEAIEAMAPMPRFDAPAAATFESDLLPDRPIFKDAAAAAMPDARVTQVVLIGAAVALMAYLIYAMSELESEPAPSNPGTLPGNS